MALGRAGGIALGERWSDGERGDGSRNDGGGAFERLHDTIPLAIIVEWPQVRQDIPVHDTRTNPASLKAGFYQPRRVGGSGSGVSSLPRRTVVVGQKARDGSAARAASAGASLRTAMGTTQPIAAMQARLMPLQGFCAGFCCCAIIFMQSSLIPESAIPDIAVGADAAGWTDA